MSNNILTNPEEIAHEIYVQQSISNMPTVPTCHYQPDHPQRYTCGVRQYPWHDIDGYTIEKRGESLISLHTYLDQETYDICLQQLANGKNPCQIKSLTSYYKICHQDSTHSFYCSLPIVTNKNKSLSPGKQASPYSYTKRYSISRDQPQTNRIRQHNIQIIH